MDIVIWGGNAFSAQLYALLEKTHVNVVAFVEGRASHSTFCGKPFYDSLVFKGRKELATLPIVLAMPHVMLFNRPIIRLKNIGEFKDKIQEVVHQHQINNPLFHPVALIDLLTFNFNNKMILFGLQGSGNVLFHQIIDAIYKKHLIKFFTKKTFSYFFETMCHEYMHIVRQVAGDVLRINGGYDVFPVAWKIGTSHLNCKFGNQPMHIYTFSTRDHILSRVSMYHQMPSSEYLNKLQTMHFKTFFVIRNPLDMILSGINKSSPIDLNTQQIDIDIFRCTARWIIDQLNMWKGYVSRLSVLRYEDLLENPILTIKKIMQFMHVRPSERLACKLWKQLGLQQLPNAREKHFWKGGVGKWEIYFNREHLSFLQACGIESILEKYHYTHVLARFKARCASISPEELTQHRKADYFHYPRCCYQDENYDTFQFLNEQHGKAHCAKTDSLFLVCKNTQYLEHIQQAFSNTFLHHIVQSGAFPEHRIV